MYKRLAIVLISIQFISIFIIALNNQLYSWDEHTYILNGLDIAGKPVQPVMKKYIAHERHPMLSWFIALFADNPLVYKLLSPICFLLLFLLLYKIGTEYYNPEVGLLSAFILITIPNILFVSVKIMSDVPGALLFSLCLYFYYKGLSKSKYFIFGGFFGGLSIVMRDMNFVLIPTLIVFYIVFRKIINLKYFFLSGLVAVLSVFPYFIDNYLRWGNPFYRIFTHINMVNKSLGYDNFFLQNWPISWLLYFPVYVGIPIFYLFVLNLYKNRKKFSNKIKFLLMWFFIPFFIFLLFQKIEPRYILILTPPVLLVGTKQLVSLKHKKLILAVILILNGFLFTNVNLFLNTKMSPAHTECFAYIRDNLPENTVIYSNANPPSTVALYTNRTIIYSPIPKSDYYLYDKKYKLEEFNGYDIIFSNSGYTLLHKV